MSDKKIEVKELDLNDILPNRFQPRIKFNEDLIIELSESIKLHGVIQPIIVRPIDDKYEIVAGERRFKASALAGLSTIPSIVLNLEDKESIEYALLENVQRENLSAIEEAITYKKILDMGYITQVQLSQKLGMSQSSIANKLRLLKLCDEVQEALIERKISERHARSLLKIESFNKQKELLYKIIKEKMTVRQLDAEISNLSEEELNKGINDEIVEENIIQSDTKLETEKIVDTLNNNLEKVNDKIDSTFINNVSDNNDRVVERVATNDNNNEAIKEETIIDLSSVLSEVFKPNNNDLANFNDIDKDAKDNKFIDDENNILTINKEENNNMFSSESKDNVIQSSGRFFDANVVEENDREENVDLNDKVNKELSSSVFDFSSGNVISTNNNSNSNIFTAKINDLISTQGISNVEKEAKNVSTDNNLSINSNITNNVNNVNDENKSSYFSNLLNNEENDSNYLNRETLNQFLDPTFVDGEKKNDESELVQTNNPIFSKFMGEDNINTNPNNNNTDIKDSSSINDENNLENKKTEVTEENRTITSKPDLLAPMDYSANVNKFNSNNNFEQKNITDEISSNEEDNINLDLLNNNVNNQLTPDSTLDGEIVEDTSVDYHEESNDESSVQPIFVNSSFDNNELSAPKTPIITNIEMSNLLSKPEAKDEESIVGVKEVNGESKDELPSTIAETAEIPTTNNNFMTSEDIQPIIITDYNKQYDPILPVSNTVVTPTIDFKHIINLIRNLNNEIESYGYKIDTEEIDLDDKYQVIFNIEKK